MDLTPRLVQLEQEVADAVIATVDEAEQFRAAYLGRQGSITLLFEEFKQLPAEQKRSLGQRLNGLKNAATTRWRNQSKASSAHQDETHEGDATAPTYTGFTGGAHPLTLITERIVRTFERIGFSVSHGPEVEDDHHNFSALNFPPDHPARDMQDTFFVEGEEGLALRTHTSSVQVRVMENSKPPIRTISPGRVYRNEAVSARAHCMFHQVEGLYVDRGVSFAELKGTVQYFIKDIFGEGRAIRMRPSYFPFTEPSAEVDMSCSICEGVGCGFCKHSGWVEIMGCGMVHPMVLSNCGIDPEAFSGFAFGMGVERITQLLYRVPDLRLYWENDLRFLKQFRGAQFKG
jgi:phenylalanyl-tRNA synthetase alpha chain